jgi:hypothetical protein
MVLSSSCSRWAGPNPFTSRSSASASSVTSAHASRPYALPAPSSDAGMLHAATPPPPAPLFRTHRPKSTREKSLGGGREARSPSVAPPRAPAKTGAARLCPQIMWTCTEEQASLLKLKKQGEYLDLIQIMEGGPEKCNAQE